MTKKIQSEALGLILQFIFLILFTWAYIWKIHATLEISFVFDEHLSLIIWHIFCVVMTCICVKFLYALTFKGIDSIFYTLYIFKNLLSISWPIAKVIEESRVNELPQSKNYAFFSKRVEELVIKLRSRGTIDKLDLDILINELWDTYEYKLEEFHKRLLFIKFSALAIFIIPSFLLSTISIVQSRLI